MRKKHYFLAIPVEGAAKQFLKEWNKSNQNEYPFRKWVHPEDWHITLAFLGASNQEQLHELTELVEKSMVEFTVFELSLHTLGTFGNESSPRIFWADVKQSSSLLLLQEKVASLCRKAGFSLENRPYRPHITLARKWEGTETFQVDEVRKSFLLENSVSWNIDKFYLYQSNVDQVPMYEPLHKFSLTT